MKNKPLIVISVLLLFFCSVCIYYVRQSHYRIAYVRTVELVYGYNGMREARVNYKTQADAWQSNVDTLRVQYQRSLSDYQTTYKTLSEKEKEGKQALIKKLEDNLKNYSSVIKQQAQEKEKEMTDAVLNQINSYVEIYAKKNGYDFIISSNNGNLLFANKAYDITDEVLEAINKEYKIIPAAKSEDHTK